MALQLETVESPMYAKLITRHSGSSSRNDTAPPAPAGSFSSGLLPSVYHRLPTSAAGNSTTTTGR